VFEGGAAESFDAVVLATGYRPGLEAFLSAAGELCDPRGFPKAGGQVVPGLHLCGFHLSTRGMLKEVGIEARRTAREISAALKTLPAAARVARADPGGGSAAMLS